MSACDTNRSAIDPSSYPSPNGAPTPPTRDADTSDSMRRKSPGVNEGPSATSASVAGRPCFYFARQRAPGNQPNSGRERT